MPRGGRARILVPVAVGGWRTFSSRCPLPPPLNRPSASPRRKSRSPPWQAGALLTPELSLRPCSDVSCGRAGVREVGTRLLLPPRFSGRVVRRLFDAAARLWAQCTCGGCHRRTGGTPRGAARGPPPGAAGTARQLEGSHTVPTTHFLLWWRDLSAGFPGLLQTPVF